LRASHPPGRVSCGSPVPAERAVFGRAAMHVDTHVDTDEFGIPKAPIQIENKLSDEELLHVQRRKQEVNAKFQANAGTVPKTNTKLSDVVGCHLTTEDYDDFGYPTVPKEWNQEYFDQLMIQEKTDPRVNPNLLLDTNEAEFWHNAARKPYAKAILRQEKHWTSRRNVWLRQYETVEMLNENRDEMMEQLEECPMEVKRLVTPIMKYKITEATVWNMMRECKDRKISLAKLLESEEKLILLRGLRKRIDTGGEKDAERMMDEYDMRSRRIIFDKQRAKEMEPTERVLSDTDTLVKCLNWGQKCKKDGSIEWEKGNYEEALASWRQADDALKKFKAPDSDKNGNKLIEELHIAVLKNVAQAAIKCEYWTEALFAADDALRIDNEDHKAWFRRACALEGLGEFAKAEEALDKVDECSVGRTDRHRVSKDVQAKRDKLEALADRADSTHRKGLERAVAKGIFSGDREEKKQITEDSESKEEQPKAVASGSTAKPSVPAGEPFPLTDKRKKLTKDGAEDLLDDLRRAYCDTLFQKQVRKLALDVRRDRVEFMVNMRKVSLEVQRPILEKWGFEATAKGVKEMQCAIQDHTAGRNPDEELREKADYVTQLLYGDMYGTVFAGLSAGHPHVPLKIVKPEDLELLE